MTAVRRSMIRIPGEPQRRASRLQGPPNPRDPDSWWTFICVCCERLFQVQSIARYCPTCLHNHAAAGIYGIETTGEASGA